MGFSSKPDCREVACNSENMGSRIPSAGSVVGLVARAEVEHS